MFIVSIEEVWLSTREEEVRALCESVWEKRKCEVVHSATCDFFFRTAQERLIHEPRTTAAQEQPWRRALSFIKLNMYRSYFLRVHVVASANGMIDIAMVVFLLALLGKMTARNCFLLEIWSCGGFECYKKSY